MKKILVASTLLAMLTSAQASNYEMMAGLEFGQSKGNYDDKVIDGVSLDLDEEWQDNFGVRVGVETKESRIYVSYNYVDTDFDVGGVSYDTQTLLLHLEAKTRPHFKILRAFAGGHLGAIYSDLDISGLGNQTDTNAIYGAQAGLLVDITDSIYFEAGYKYSWTSASDDSINPDSVQTYYGALNFKF